MTRFYVVPGNGPNLEKVSENKWREILKDDQHHRQEHEKTTWNRDYRRNNYGNVLSLTDDSAVRNRISGQLKKEYQEIFIAGCGSKTDLQESICNEFPGVHIVCGDFAEEALEIAEKAFTDPRVDYRLENSTRLSFADGLFDAVIVVNSVISADAICRKMLSEFHRVLKPGTGKLVALFPTINCAFELVHLAEKLAPNLVNGSIDYAKNTVWEPVKEVAQLFYSPIRLKIILENVGFGCLEMSYLFLDSDHFYHGEYKEKYPAVFTRKNGLCIYENFVTALAK